VVTTMSTTHELTEASAASSGQFWPGGIDYAGVRVPAAAPREAFADPLDDLIDLED
jgi:hypothetical protein